MRAQAGAAGKNLQCAIVRALFDEGDIGAWAGGFGRERCVGGRNRRRVERPMEPAAAERRRRRWRALGRWAIALPLIAVAAAGLTVTWRALDRARAFDLRTLRFEGLARASADDLRALSPARPGDHLLSIDPGAVEAALLRHPWVRSVEVRRSWPPALSVRVTERQAAALIDLGGLYLVDEEGEVFKRALPGDGLDLPLLTGVSRGDWLLRRAEVRPLVKGALVLARTYEAAGMAGTDPLSEIHLEPGEGTTIYVGAEGTEVRLGSGDLEAKLSRLKRMLSALGAEGKQAEVLHLDNRLHPDWVTVRLASRTSP